MAEHDPSPAGRIAAHAELPIAQMRQPAIFARRATRADTDGARLAPGVVAARAATASQRRIDGRLPATAAADKRFHSSAVNPFHGASKFSNVSRVFTRPRACCAGRVRAWTAATLSVVAIVAGCGQRRAARRRRRQASDDPLTLPETPIAAETLPGTLDGAWPLPVARGAHGWLLPFSDGGAVHARLVGDDGARDDCFVDSGTLVGAAALADGFAVVVAADGAARVHFLGADGSDSVVAAPLDGDAVPGSRQRRRARALRRHARRRRSPSSSRRR